MLFRSQQAIQDGTIPAYVGIPLLQEKVKQSQQAQQVQAANAPKQAPVAQQVMQAANQVAGIDHLSSNLPAEGMAGGGIVAFDDGGEVEHFATGNKVSGVNTDGYIIMDSPYPGSPYDQSIFGWAPRAGKAIVSDMLGLPGQLGWAPYSKDKGLQRNYQAEGWFPEMSNFEANEAARVAGGNKRTQQIVAQAKQDQIARQQGIDNPNLRPASADKAGIQALAGTDNQTNPLLPALQAQEAAERAGITDVKAPPSAPSADALSAWSNKLAATGPGAGPVKWDDIKGNAADWEALKKPTRSYEDYAAEYEQRVGKNEGLEERKSHLNKMEEALKGEMETSPWMALMRAGLATMGGTSQYALTNIGKGGEEGLNDYIKRSEEHTSELQSH